MGARSVLVLAELADSERSAIEQDCQNCNFDVTWLTSAETVAAKLISGRFDALVVHLQTPGAARACVEARKTLTRVRFPIMALADQVDDATFSKAFRVGVDDVIDLTASAQVSQRLAAIPRASWKPVARSRGEALIVDPDNGRAEALARLLKEAGYLIKNARDEPSAKLHLWRQSIRLVVADNSVQETARWIKEGNSKEWHPIWIVRARPDQMDEISEQLYAFTNASAVNIYLGDADVLYETNRLSAAYESRRAAAARLFHGTTVTFSTGAAETLDGQWIEHGSSYSVDVHEIAVRTLALPPSTELELSLTPPGQTTPITLQADVTQRRVFGDVQDQSAPPGFTARLAGENLALWRDAIRLAGRQRFGAKWTASGDAPVAAKSSAGTPAVAEAPPKSSEPPSSIEPTSPSPTNPPPPAGPASSSPMPSVPISVDAPSSRPSSSQPTSSQPRSSPRGPGATDSPDSEPPGTKPGLSDEPSSSKRNRPPSSPDASGSVPIARVRLVSATAAQGGNRGTTPTLKSLHNEVAEMQALSHESEPDAPSTTPSRIERGLADPEQSPGPKAVVPAAGGSAQGSRAAGDARAPTAGNAAPDARRPREAAPGATGSPARSKIVVPANPAAAAAPVKRKVNWAAIAIVLAAVVGLGVLATRQKPPATTTSPETASAPTNAAEAPGTASPSPPAATTEATAPVATTVSSAATNEPPANVPSEVAPDSSAAEPAASAATPSAPGASPLPPQDPSQLAGHLGYLYVSSPIDTQVFVQGKVAGKTNSYLEVFCGRRYLRLGAAPGEWQSEGVGFKIACQQVSRVTLRPTRVVSP